MKKLYYIANIRLPTEKAHGVQIMKMCESFANLGVEVELLVSSRKTHISEDPFEYYKVKRNFKIKKLWCIDSVRFGRLGFLLESYTFAESVAWYVLFKKGVFYSRDELLALYMKLAGKKVVWEVHMGPQNFFARLLLASNTPIVVVTNGLKGFYIKNNAKEKNILVAHDAFDQKSFEELPTRAELKRKLHLPATSFIVGYIGKYKTLGRTKGVEDLITPFKRLQEEHPESFLLIVGPDASETAEIEADLTKAAVPAHAYRIVGHMPHAQTSAYIKASDLLVLPYPNIPHYAHFMSPLKLFEYMGSGNAILASDLPSLREVLWDDSAFFFNPDTEGDLYRSLSYALLHPDEREAKAKQSHLDSGHYTWEKRAQKIIDFCPYPNE